MEQLWPSSYITALPKKPARELTEKERAELKRRNERTRQLMVSRGDPPPRMSWFARWIDETFSF